MKRKALKSMKNKENDKREFFAKALKEKKIPILTLDNKWYKLLTDENREEVSGLEEELNALLKQQGKLNNEVKDIKRLKKKLMDEIVSMMNETEQDEEISKKIEQNRVLVEECNGRLEKRRDELLELPRQIEQINFQLMLFTMDCCYDTMKQNTEEIQEIAQWVAEIRVDLKKRLIKKQEMENRNNAIYSYMHDVFGPDVIEMFDMQYNPEEKKSSS